MVLKVIWFFFFPLILLYENCGLSHYFLHSVCKVCAANFGDICSVVGQQATEEMLVSHFWKDFFFLIQFRSGARQGAEEGQLMRDCRYRGSVAGGNKVLGVVRLMF